MFTRIFNRSNMIKNLNTINLKNINLHNKINKNSFTVTYLQSNRNFSQTKTTYKLEYTDTGEWLYNENGNYKIGLTNNSIEELNELVFIEYEFEEGDQVSKGDELVIVESVKATNAIISPIDCTIIEINREIENNLENVNENPECTDTAWFMKLAP